MESIREQIIYGSRCMHGTPVGTPGGADLMCGLCEDGYTHWVEDPTYTLWFRFSDEPLDSDVEVPWTRITQWQESAIPALLRDGFFTPGSSRDRFWPGVLDQLSPEVLAKVQHKVTMTAAGYWDTFYDFAE